MTVASSGFAVTTAACAVAGYTGVVDSLSEIQVTRVPVDRLRPAPWNPRTIRDPRFENLCRSIEADPDFLERRPILAQADGTVYGGNMRLRAVQHLGWSDVPAILDDIPDQLAKERALKDNRGWGDDVEDELGALLASLGDAGTDLSLLGFEDGELERLLAQADGRIVDPDQATGEWQGMPEFDHEDKMAHRMLTVYFGDDEAVADFSQLIGQGLTDETKSIWHPAQKPRVLGQYMADES